MPYGAGRPERFVGRLRCHVHSAISSYPLCRTPELRTLSLTRPRLDSDQLHATRSATLDGHRGLTALEVISDECDQLLIGFAINWS